MGPQTTPPTPPQEAEQWLLDTINLMVDDPQQVSVTVTPEDDVVVLNVSTSASDIGKVIGRQGRTVQSLRALVGLLGKRHDHRFEILIAEEQ